MRLREVWLKFGSIVGMTGSIVGLIVGAAPARASIWPNSVERIERQLVSPNPATRRGAAVEIRDLPKASARRLVRRALRDPDLEVRITAAGIASAMRVPGAGDEVVEWLGDPERRLRLAAAELLGVTPSQRALAGLGRALGDPDNELRVAAAAALGALGKPAASILLGHLDDTVPPVRERVVAALGEIGDQSAVVPLVGKIQDTQGTVRRAVARALGRLGDQRAVSALILTVRDPDEAVRQSAVEALGRLGSAEAAPVLGGLVESDVSENVRQAAARGLAQIGSSDAIDALIRALADPVTMASAERALLGVGKAAATKLEHCLNSANSPIRADGCARVLGRIRSGNESWAIREAWQRGAVDAKAALLALGELGDPVALPWALEHLVDAEPRVRRAALDASAALLDPSRPDGRAVAPILAAMEQARARIAEKRALVALLGRTGSTSALPALKALVMGTHDLGLRLVAIEALGRIRPAGQDQELLEALEDERPPVRLAAALALRTSASPACTGALLDRLERAAEQDRALTTLALGGALSRTPDPKLVARVARLAEGAQDAERDGLIEALGSARLAEAVSALGALASGTSGRGDRAKVAEALASQATGIGILRRLARDPDESVRANAIWSLGSIGVAEDRDLLRSAAHDGEVAVAGNAVAALARVALRTGIDAENELCSALQDERSYVRANALNALALTGRRCAEEQARSLLLTDGAAIVRRAAAWLIWHVPSKDTKADTLARLRCQDEERAGEVAALCAEAPSPSARTTDPVIVYVVPMGEPAPVASTPFALIRSDGLMRLGFTDRRGAIFEHDAPRGLVRLTLPAPMAE